MDASDVEVVLLQRTSPKKSTVLAPSSHTEHNYSVGDKELLTIKLAFGKGQQPMLGGKASAFGVD